jgi:cellulose synthase/poly-beta-1,6-N-acetylglucosamine synthase-like glycosyltransferase
MIPSEAARSRITDRRWFIRSFEILPGALTYSILIGPVILSMFVPVAVAYFIIAFDIFWMLKSFRLSFNLIRSFRRLRRANNTNWNERLLWLNNPNTFLEQTKARLSELAESHLEVVRRFWWSNTPAREEYSRLRDDFRLQKDLSEHDLLLLNPKDIYNAVILATYNESMDILEPSVIALTEVEYPQKQIMLVIAYEERGGAETEAHAHELIKRYGHHFALAMAVKHPDGIVGEVRGKGGNITYAGREFTKEIIARGIDPENVIVTTFDSDHRASKNYFSYLTFVYCSNPNRVHKSFQPIPMFYNNIWDVPAPMRVIATGNTFWVLMETMRPHRLRNFAAHAQSLETLIATDYWSVTTIVEDGHQFWRTYFAYDGDHEVVPMFTGVYQDAVLAESYIKTFQAQFLQLRRWAWGATDIQFVVRNAITNPRIPWGNKLTKILLLIESHVTWATVPLVLLGVAWLPLYLNRSFSYLTLAHRLPEITSNINTLSSATIILTALISLISLPPRPARYGKGRTVFMFFQWALLPITSIFFGAFAALNAQTRLMFGKYLEFYVTEKATKK